ncbi:MAG: hypothetical protein ACOVO3_09185 [Fluviicola sp.]|jgi:hypothetical protein
MVAGLLQVIATICVYALGIVLMNGFPLLTDDLLALAGNAVIFLLSTTLIHSGKDKAPDARVQRFILGTSVQMILALFYLLLVRYKFVPYFRVFVWDFLLLFVLLLAVQAVALILKARRAK